MQNANARCKYLQYASQYIKALKKAPNIFIYKSPASNHEEAAARCASAAAPMPGRFHVLICPKQLLVMARNRRKANSPILQLVMMASSVNSNQHSGCLSMTLVYCMLVVSVSLFCEQSRLTMTGGSIGMRALGSTACAMPELSSLLWLIIRSAAPAVDEIEPRCLCCCLCMIVSNFSHLVPSRTYSLGPMQHHGREIPQA